MQKVIYTSMVKRKKKSFILVFFCTALVIFGGLWVLNVMKSVQNFSGHWEEIGIGAKSPSDPSPVESSFTLDLIQEGTMLRGKYCAKLLIGGRIDCDDTNRITGTIKGNVADLLVITTNDGVVNAHVTMGQNALIWQIIENSLSENSLPLQSKLTKRNEMKILLPEKLDGNYRMCKDIYCNTFTIKTLETGREIVYGQAFWKGQLEGQLNTGYIYGEMQKSGDRLSYISGNCQIDFTFAETNAVLKERSESSCGGLNVSFDGLFTKEKSKQNDSIDDRDCIDAEEIAQSPEDFFTDKWYMSFATSGESGQLRADKSIPVQWGLDYAGPNDTRPSTGTGSWDLLDGALLLDTRTSNRDVFTNFRFYSYKGNVFSVPQENDSIVFGPSKSSIEDFFKVKISPNWSTTSSCQQRNKKLKDY